MKCEHCNGLGIIGTSIGSTMTKGTDYKCDICNGSGEVDTTNLLHRIEKLNLKNAKLETEKKELLKILKDILQYDGEILREEFQLNIVNTIEKVTGLSIKEVLK